MFLTSLFISRYFKTFNKTIQRTEQGTGCCNYVQDDHDFGVMYKLLCTESGYESDDVNLSKKSQRLYVVRISPYRRFTDHRLIFRVQRI